MISVVIADDQALVRGGIRLILEAQHDLQVVGEAVDGATAIQVARATTPDVVLMDVAMPVVDGIEATRQIAGQGTAPRVLVLTTFDRDDYLYDAVRAGAAGFLLKSAPPEMLVAAVRTVAGGETFLAPAITQRLLGEFVRRPKPGDGPPTPVAVLTERELDVLRLIAAGRSNREIASHLYLSEGTVKTHVNRILTKLDLRDRVQAVVLAYESGLIRPGDPAV